VEALAEFNIGREQILARWWEFASIDPKLTGYNTSGQTKALDSLWKALGFEGSKNPGEEETEPDPPDIYRAPWMEDKVRGMHPKRDENHEPVLSSAERPPAPEPARIERRPAAVAELPIEHPGSDTRKRTLVEPPLSSVFAFDSGAPQSPSPELTTGFAR
jgi:hypothetical protein